METTAAIPKPRFKKGDQVQVISGKSKGQKGEVLRLDRKGGKVLIKGVNMQKKHTKPRTQEDKGGIIPQEGPVHVSNVLVYCNSCDRGVRKVCENSKECKYKNKS